MPPVKIKDNQRLRKHEKFTPLNADEKHVLLHISMVQVHVESRSKGYPVLKYMLGDVNVTPQITMLYGRRLVYIEREKVNGRNVLKCYAHSEEMWQAGLDDSLYAMI